MSVRYQIVDPESRSGWSTVSKAVEVVKDGKRNGWLHYEIREDGSTTVGLAQPGQWRVRP